MEKTESTNTNPKQLGVKGKKVRKSISEIKKELGLDQYIVIHQPIKVKKDGKHLYKVVGYAYPLRPETIERLNISSQKILYEVDREQWHREMDEAIEKQDETINQELYPWGYEE